MRNNILIIGYGSIGRRHGQVLNYLGNEVAFIRTGKSTIKDDDFLKDKEIFYDLEAIIVKIKKHHKFTIVTFPILLLPQTNIIQKSNVAEKGLITFLSKL